MARIVLTGGGTAGHVTPHLALIPKLREAGWEIHYIGSKDGIERSLVTEIPYTSIAVGKLRRYFDWRNFTDPFRVLWGTIQAFLTLRRLRPQVVFSKGGFVSVPVGFAAKLLRIPIILHESDMTPGLANKLVIPLAEGICVSFAETAKHLPAEKVVYTGTPLREELFHGDAQKGRELCGFDPLRPIVLVMGGSLGAVSINEALRQNLDAWLGSFQIIHLCGKGNLVRDLQGRQGYCQFEYVREEMADILASADFIVSRAGANSISELMALRKPALLIPLPLASSRGDQIENARFFVSEGFGRILVEEDLSPERLLDETMALAKGASSYRKRLNESAPENGTANVLSILQRYQ